MKKRLVACLAVPFYLFASYSYIGEEKIKYFLSEKHRAKVTINETENLSRKNLIEKKVSELGKYSERQLEGMFDRKLEIDREKYRRF